MKIVISPFLKLLDSEIDNADSNSIEISTLERKIAFYQYELKIKELPIIYFNDDSDSIPVTQ